MGGSELLLLPDYLTPEQQDAVEIEGASCLEFCKEQMGKEGRGKSPFIKINDEVISEASVQTALEKINELLAAGGGIC
jgi:hypothetical protein